MRKNMSSLIGAAAMKGSHLAALAIKSPSDLALLLKTSEVKIFIQCLDLLLDIILTNREEVKHLIEDGLLDDVFFADPNPHPAFNATRYRFLIRVFNILPEARVQFLDKKEFLDKAMLDAMTTHDTALRAYGLEYVVLLTEAIPSKLEDLVELYDINKIFSTFLSDSDIDVQYNALRLLKNLLKEPKTNKMIPTLKDFKFRQLLAQVGCPYPDIQNKALDVIQLLVSYESDKRKWLQENFSSSGGLDLLFSVLFVFHWRDLHKKCLNILENMADNSTHILNLDSVNGINQLVDYIAFIEDDELQALDMDVLVNVVKFPEGRLVASRCGLFPVLKDLIQDGSEMTKMKAMSVLMTLCQPPADLTQLSRNDPSVRLLVILKDDEYSDQLKSSAAIALSTLVQHAPYTVLILSEKKHFTILKNILYSVNPTNKEFTISILKTMWKILSNPTVLTRHIDVKFVKRILYLIHTAPKETVIEALHILTVIITRETGRFIFINYRGVSRIVNQLHQSMDRDLMEAMGAFLTVAFQENELKSRLLRSGISSWLRKQEKSGRLKECPELNKALRTLLEADLSIKFELCGRLDISDITTDRFYFYRSPIQEYQDARTLVASNILDTPLSRPIFYLCMGLESTQATTKDDLISLFHYVDENKEEDELPDLSILETAESKLSMEKQTPPATLQLDSRLLELYEGLQGKLDESKLLTQWKGVKRLSREWIEKMVKLIAGTVMEAMSGIDKFDHHSYELHIGELKEKFGSPLIPIGALEVGGELERAALFKILSDRFAFPCSLHRGDYATGWVQVALPGLRSVAQLPYRELPLEQLETNYIVDLMDEPGKLIPLESGLTYKYFSEPMINIEKLKKFNFDGVSDVRNKMKKIKQQYHIEEQ